MSLERERELCGLWDNVSPMLLFVCKKLDFGEMKYTNISLQLQDRSAKYLVGILEDIPVKIG